MFKNLIYDNLKKIRIYKNTKIPIDKGWQKIENMTTTISIEKYNIGLPTGKINNLLCLDIDNKDNGIEEFDKYIKEFGEPMTIKQQTPSGGYHYIFKYTSSNIQDNYLIENYLKNKTKYRNVINL